MNTLTMQISSFSMEKDKEFIFNSNILLCNIFVYETNVKIVSIVKNEFKEKKK